MNLVIDIGNTRTKYSLFQQSEYLFTIYASHFQGESISNIFSEYPTIGKTIISSTRSENPEWIEFIRKKTEILIVLDQRTPVPIKCLYKTPETLGRDRLAAVVGANYLYPGSNLLVIDAGTALTYDLVTEKGEYLGGNISPGLVMRFRALHNFTEKLPLIHDSNKFSLWGDSTENAIRSGVQNGILFEIETFIEHFKKNYKKNAVIFTGGDTKFFESNLKSSFFVHSNLVATGLNRILEYNAEKL